jgi:hypothetical protein
MTFLKTAIGVTVLGIGAIGSSFTNHRPAGMGWFIPAEDEAGVGTIPQSDPKNSANYPLYYGASQPLSATLPTSGRCSANSGNVCAAEFTITAHGGAGTYQNQYVTGQYNY